MIPSKVYDVLKPIAQIWLPAFGALYFSLAQIWGLPQAEEVVGTVTVVDTFLGVVLGLSTAQYNNSDNAAGKYDGDLTVYKAPEGQQMVNMEFNKEPEKILAQPEALFKVKDAQPPAK